MIIRICEMVLYKYKMINVGLVIFRKLRKI